jgi:dynein regulatry complex protein 1
MKLTSEYKRVTEQFKDLQIKFKHFELTDTKKYSDLWQMKEQTVVAMAKKVIAADKVIHEQQLGLEWRPPVEEVRQS